MQGYFICPPDTCTEAHGRFELSLGTESARRKAGFHGAGCSVGGPPGWPAQWLGMGRAGAEEWSLGYALFIEVG
jgi:hypothetical protein